MGVFVESVRHIFAKRQPDARLLTAYVNPCASAYLWTMLTALFQVFLRSNESLSKAKSCVKLRADITDVYLAICFEIMRERNKEDYGNETRHAVGQKAPQVADELLWKMTQHKGKSLGDNDVKAQAVLESLDEILGFLLQNDKALSPEDADVATELATFAKEVLQDKSKVDMIIAQFSKLQLLGAELEDEFWDSRSSLHVRGQTFVLAVHLYASRERLSFEECMGDERHLLAIRAEVFKQELPEPAQRAFIRRVREVVTAQAGQDGKSNRADPAGASASYGPSMVRKTCYYAREVAALLERGDGISADQAERQVSQNWKAMNVQARKGWAKEHKLTETIEMLRDPEAFDAYVEQHGASLAGKDAQTTVADTQRLLRRIGPQALAERQAKLIERRRRAAQREALGLEPWQCEHKRRRSQCKECGGASICQHARERSTCKECGGSSICQHARRRSECRNCGGGSICQHNRIRSRCKTCKADKDASMPPELEEL